MKPGRDTEVLVSVLRRALAPSAMVRSPHTVRDLATGERREVDVYVEQDHCGQKVRMAFECRHHKRKVSVGYIEQVATKARDLEDVDMLHVVSTAGFTRGALAKARHHKVHTYTLDEVVEPGWAQWIARAVFVEVRFDREVQGLSLHVASDMVPGHYEIPDRLREATPLELPLSSEDGTTEATVGSFLKKAVDDAFEGLGRKISTTEPTKLRLKVQLSKTPHRYIRFLNGSVPIGLIDAMVLLRPNHEALMPAYREYRDALAGTEVGRVIDVRLRDGTTVGLTIVPGTGDVRMHAAPASGATTAKVGIQMLFGTATGEDRMVEFELKGGDLVGAGPVLIGRVALCNPGDVVS